MPQLPASVASLVAAGLGLGGHAGKATKVVLVLVLVMAKGLAGNVVL